MAVFLSESFLQTNKTTNAWIATGYTGWGEIHVENQIRGFFTNSGQDLSALNYCFEGKKTQTTTRHQHTHTKPQPKIPINTERTNTFLRKRNSSLY